MSPTQRSLADLRARGMLAQVVERWVPRAKKRVDLFGFIDIVALGDLSGVIGIQVTTTSHLADRLRKIQGECQAAAMRWIGSGNHILLHGWSKKGPRGKRKVWTLTERWVGGNDLL